MEESYLPLSSSGDLACGHGRGRGAKLLALLYAGIAFALGGIINYCFVTEFPSWRIVSTVLHSPWSITVVVDFTAGLVFATTFLCLREGPYLACFPPALAAAAMPALGNQVLFFYVATVLLPASPTVAAALLPVVPAAAAALGERGERGRMGWWTFLFASAAASVACVCAWAASTQSVAAGWEDIRAEIWVLLTFVDLLAGLLFVAVFIFVREGGLTVMSAGMTVALALTGNIATGVYMLSLVREAAVKGLPFRTVLFSKKGAFDLP